MSYRPASLCSLAIQFQTRFLEGWNRFLAIPSHIAGLKFRTQAGTSTERLKGKKSSILLAYNVSVLGTLNETASKKRFYSLEETMTGKCAHVQEVLLDFTVHYLVSQPSDLVDFALEYFRCVNLCKTTLGYSCILCLKKVATVPLNHWASRRHCSKILPGHCSVFNTH